jgi:hypothetical protein
MGGFMTQSRTLARLLTAAGAVIAALALLVPVASAAEPNPGYEQFKGCPSKAEVPPVAFCQRVHIDGGYVDMGSKTVPIENPMDLVGGLSEGGSFVGGVFPPVKQKVPGGLVGLTGLTWLLEFFGSEALTLYATTELAGVPGNAFEEPIKLPVKVHLTNPGGLLGGTCYIGSVTEPIKFNLQVGTTSPPPPNEPITGIEPEFSEDTELGIFILSNGQFVDNSFAAPGANGCKLTVFGIPFSINGLVNSQSGLPAAAGTNETRQDFDIEFTSVESVY